MARQGRTTNQHLIPTSDNHILRSPVHYFRAIIDGRSRCHRRVRFPRRDEYTVE